VAGVDSPPKDNPDWGDAFDSEAPEACQGDFHKGEELSPLGLLGPPTDIVREGH